MGFTISMDAISLTTQYPPLPRIGPGHILDFCNLGNEFQPPRRICASSQSVIVHAYLLRSLNDELFSAVTGIGMLLSKQESDMVSLETAAERINLQLYRNRLCSRFFTSAAPHTADLVTGMYFALLLLQHRVLLLYS